MEKILKQIIKKLDRFDERFERIDERLDRFDERLERLEPLVEESHQWIRALVESNEVHKAEMDNVKNDLARVEGVLVGFDNSLETLKKAQ